MFRTSLYAVGVIISFRWSEEAQMRSSMTVCSYAQCELHEDTVCQSWNKGSAQTHDLTHSFGINWNIDRTPDILTSQIPTAQLQSLIRRLEVIITVKGKGVRVEGWWWYD